MRTAVYSALSSTGFMKNDIDRSCHIFISIDVHYHCWSMAAQCGPLILFQGTSPSVCVYIHPSVCVSVYMFVCRRVMRSKSHGKKYDRHIVHALISFSNKVGLGNLLRKKKKVYRSVSLIFKSPWIAK
jgi:hypothetical protein